MIPYDDDDDLVNSMVDLPSRIKLVERNICPKCGRTGTLTVTPMGENDEGEEAYESAFWCTNCGYFYRDDVAGYARYLLEIFGDGDILILAGDDTEAFSIISDARVLKEYMNENQEDDGTYGVSLADIYYLIGDELELAGDLEIENENGIRMDKVSL